MAGAQITSDKIARISLYIKPECRKAVDSQEGFLSSHSKTLFSACHIFLEFIHVTSYILLLWKL
jgi:hypothetical protein